MDEVDLASNHLGSLDNLGIPKVKRTIFAKRERVLKPECVRNPHELIDQWLDERGGKGIIVHGDQHPSGGTWEEKIALITHLSHRYGLKTVYLEEDASQSENLMRFMKTGVMSVSLHEYLMHGFFRRHWKKKSDVVVRLIKRCREKGIMPIFLDDRRYRDKVLEDKEWAGRIERDLGYKVDDLVLVATGKTHVFKNFRKGSGRKSMATLLDRKFPGMVLSVLGVTLSGESWPFLDPVEAGFMEGISRLFGEVSQPYGAFVKDTPYAQEKVKQSFPNVAANSLDMVYVVPGEYR